jgi:hypothetical protein
MSPSRHRHDAREELAMADSPQTTTGDDRRRAGEVADQPPKKPRRQLIRPAFKAVFQFAKYMITLPVVLVRGRRGNIDEVTVYSAHPSFFLWLLIAVGFISSAIVAQAPNWAGFFGWLYVWVLLYFMVTLLYDFSTRKLALWVLIFALIWFASKYVELLKHVALLSSAACSRSSIAARPPR